MPCSLRNSQPIAFTQQGKILLSLADEVLPAIAQAEQNLKQQATPEITVAIDCHACFQWLLPAKKKIEQAFACQIVLQEHSFEHKSQVADLCFSDRTIDLAAPACEQQQQDRGGC